MSDLLEDDLRAVLCEHAARIDPAASVRLRAIDYRPRQRRGPSRPALGALGLSGAAAAAGAALLLGSSAAPAFAGWTPSPTTPGAGQLAQAEQACGAGLGTPVLTDTRGPYTASIYADATSTDTCLQGGSLGSINSSASSSSPAGVAAGQIALNGTGTEDSSGNALTLVDGRIGAGVTAVTIERSDGSSVQATVSNGWYLAWWPGTVRATTAQITTATGTATDQFPSAPAPQIPTCPAGGHCSSGYGFNSGGAGSGSNSAMRSMVTTGAGGGPNRAVRGGKQQ